MEHFIIQDSILITAILTIIARHPRQHAINVTQVITPLTLDTLARNPCQQVTHAITPTTSPTLHILASITPSTSQYYAITSMQPKLARHLPQHATYTSTPPTLSTSLTLLTLARHSIKQVTYATHASSNSTLFLKLTNSISFNV